MKLKYRAWHKPNKIMLDVIAINFSLMQITADIETSKIYPKLDYWWKETEIPFSEIVLTQSTGLKDKNGAEIFEGDIVKVHRFQQGHVGGNYGVVEVEEEMVCVVEKATVEPYIYPCEWFLVDVYDEEPENLWLSSGLHEESYEVIGNIFENESLLKELE